MKKNIWIALTALVLLIVYLNKTNSGFSPPATIGNAFIALCPPGQMPASYTVSDSTCVPYQF